MLCYMYVFLGRPSLSSSASRFYLGIDILWLALLAPHAEQTVGLARYCDGIEHTFCRWLPLLVLYLLTNPRRSKDHGLRIGLGRCTRGDSAESRCIPIRDIVPLVSTTYNSRTRGISRVVSDISAGLTALPLQATGWFLTHGGHNSVIEAIGQGVPM